MLDDKRRMEEDISLRARHIELDADAELEDVRGIGARHCQCCVGGAC